MTRPVPPLHVVTDDEVLGRGDFVRRAEAVLAAGDAVVLHVRGPATGGRRLWEIARRLRPAATETGALLVVNDRVDVARLAGADGVHLGERSLPADVARTLLAPDALVGVSVHGPAGAARAAAAGADYLVVGTVFETPSHPGRPGAGVELLDRVAVAAPGVPLVAIGGVSPERVAPCRAAGARGVAVLRGVWEPSDTEGAVAGYLEVMGEWPGPPTGAPGPERRPGAAP